MCTCIDLTTKDHYFGRTLDLEYKFGEKVVVTPRNYLLNLKNGEDFRTKYSIIGMATVVSNKALYADATNEEGLSMAGLNFPGNSYLFDIKESKLNLAVFELITYFLGKYKSIKEAREDINNLNIINIPFQESMPTGEMHYMLCDRDDCIVVEQTKDGLKVYENPYRVMTNNPVFSYHLDNVRNYMGLSPRNKENSFSKEFNLNTYGQGMGSIGLPGDTSPASRFVRACFNRTNSVSGKSEEESVGQFFHILDSVSMVRGSTITKEGNYDITTYSSCINTDKGIYYYKTYDNSQINAVTMTEELKNKNDITIFNLVEKQNINYQN